MSEFIIKGGKRLGGRLTVQGSKNAVLPILSAVLLTNGVVELYNCPQLSDVNCALEILNYLGCTAVQEGDVICADCRRAVGNVIPDRLMKRMRSSVVFMGALLARTGYAELSYPGGCRLGARPINYHIDGLRAMGAEVEEQDERVICRRAGLKGSKVKLPFPSVGATENLMLAATGARGETVIQNAAREPEIVCLANFLRTCGAEIFGDGTGEIRVNGGIKLHGADFTIMPDRIVTGTYLCAAAASRGAAALNGVCPKHNVALINKLRLAGCLIESDENNIYIICPERPRGTGITSTAPYPAFATDMQPPLMGLMCAADGDSIFIENIFESRYNHIDDLRRMGACIEVDGFKAIVKGSSLHGAVTSASDLRGGAALITAALSAEGTTVIGGSEYIDRGYENIEDKLALLGVDIVRR